MRATVVVSDSWSFNKVVPTGIDGPKVKLGLSYYDSVVISLIREVRVMENLHI